MNIHEEISLSVQVRCFQSFTLRFIVSWINMLFIQVYVTGSILKRIFVREFYNYLLNLNVGNKMQQKIMET